MQLWNTLTYPCTHSSHVRRAHTYYKLLSLPLRQQKSALLTSLLIGAGIGVRLIRGICTRFRPARLPALTRFSLTVCWRPVMLSYEYTSVKSPRSKAAARATATCSACVGLRKPSSQHPSHGACKEYHLRTTQA